MKPHTDLRSMDRTINVRRALRPVPSAVSRRGVALAIAMILLIVLALVGLAAMRGTILQEKMAANLSDRQVAFQSAEAAIRVATALLPSNPGLIARNCQAGGTVCLGNPFTDASLPSGSIHDVVASGGSTSSTAFDVSAVAASEPQFVIENMGNYTNPTTDTGFGNTANSRNYGVQGASATSIYYRITARSGDPAKVGDRAVVTLQATIKQG